MLLVLDLSGAGQLLDAQADPSPAKIDIDYLGIYLIAYRYDLLGELDMLPGHLGDVDQSLDARGNLHKGPERDQLGHLAVDGRPRRLLLAELLPGILLRFLE